MNSDLDPRSHSNVVTQTTRSKIARGGEGFEDFSAPERNPLWKRGLDLSVILLFFPVLAVVGLAIGLWVKFLGRGSVFFHQERVGYRGKTFTIYKFRSMKENAETRAHEHHIRALVESDSPLTKLDRLGDNRLIPGGGILRKSGLDELPQLWNVLRGEMSLVGPRPCLKEEYANYALPQRERFDTRPGLTGYWQVNGKNSTTFTEMVALDVHYIRNRSLWLDLGILCKTPQKLVSQLLEPSVNSSELNRLEAQSKAD